GITELREGFGAVYRDQYEQYDYSTNRTMNFNGTGFFTGNSMTVTYPNSIGLYMGMNYGGEEKFSGDICEIVLYGSTQSSRQTISANQSAYWGITNPASSFLTNDGFNWTPVYIGGFQSAYTINGNRFFPQSALNSWSLWKSSNASSDLWRFEVRQGDDW